MELKVGPTSFYLIYGPVQNLFLHRICVIVKKELISLRGQSMSVPTPSGAGIRNIQSILFGGSRAGVFVREGASDQVFAVLSSFDSW